MVGDCMKCRKEEEQLYWAHFHPLQFIQFLSGRFDQHLAIPDKFARNLREKMSGTVTLTGPSEQIWEVGLVVANGGTLLLKHGWKTFVEENSLEENDILIFKYRGGLKFDVSVFEQESQCEKVVSYFVRKCKHEESMHGDKPKKNVVVELEEEEEDEEERTEEDNAESSDDERRVKRQRVLKTTGTLLPRIHPTHLAPTSRRKRTQRGKQGSSSGYSLQLKSRRREVTEEETNRVQQIAAEAAASSDNGFAVIMRASHVYKGFFMSIPVDWTKAHFPRESQDVQLRVKDTIWVVKYHYRGNGGGLCNGWRKFVLDNCLEERDVCLFDIASGSHNPCLLDVRIFRVVEDVVPPTTVT